MSKSIELLPQLGLHGTPQLGQHGTELLPDLLPKQGHEEIRYLIGVRLRKDAHRWASHRSDLHVRYVALRFHIVVVGSSMAPIALKARQVFLPLADSQINIVTIKDSWSRIGGGIRMS